MNIQMKWSTPRYAMLAEFNLLDGELNQWSFELRANVLGTDKHSTATLVNDIMEELQQALLDEDEDEDELDEKFYADSTWILSDDQMLRIHSMIASWQHHSKWLEKCLDKDREVDEWEGESDYAEPQASRWMNAMLPDDETPLGIQLDDNPTED